MNDSLYRLKDTLSYGLIFTTGVASGLLWLALTGVPTRLGTQTPKQTGVYEVTAYCPCRKCCGEYSDGITASGHIIKPGDHFVAADKSIPFGATVKIPGYADGRPVPVLDRGGAIGPGHLDVFFPTHQEALRWGRQKLEVLFEGF